MHIKSKDNFRFRKIREIVFMLMIVCSGYGQVGTDTDRSVAFPRSLEHSKLASEKAFGDDGFDIDRGDDVPSVISEVLAEQSLGEVRPGDPRRPFFNLEKCMPCANPFILDSEIDYEITTGYYNRKITEFGQPVIKQNTAATAPTIKYRSGWWNDMIKFGFTAVTVFKLSNAATAGNTGIPSLLKNGEDNYTLLRHLYIHTKFNNIQTLLGRQYLRAPLLGSGAETSFMPSDFEAYLLQVHDFPIEGFKLLGGHVTKMRFNGGVLSPRAMKFRSMSESALAIQNKPDITKRRGVTTLVGLYEPNDEVNIGFAYHYGWDTLNAYYGEMSYTKSFDNCLAIEGCGQLIYQGSVGEHLIGVFNAYGYGLKLQVKYKGLYGITTTTQTLSRGDGLFDYWGDYTGFSSQVLSDFNNGGERAYGVGLGYDFAYDCVRGLTLSGNYVYGHRPNPQPGEREMNFTMDYIFPQDSLRGLWFRLRIVRLDRSSQVFSPNENGTRVSAVRLFLYYTRPII